MHVVASAGAAVPDPDDCLATGVGLRCGIDMPGSIDRRALAEIRIVPDAESAAYIGAAWEIANRRIEILPTCRFGHRGVVSAEIDYRALPVNAPRGRIEIPRIPTFHQPRL